MAERLLTCLTPVMLQQAHPIERLGAELVLMWVAIRFPSSSLDPELAVDTTAFNAMKTTTHHQDTPPVSPWSLQFQVSPSETTFLQVSEDPPPDDSDTASSGPPNRLGIFGRIRSWTPATGTEPDAIQLLTLITQENSNREDLELGEGARRMEYRIASVNLVMSVLGLVMMMMMGGGKLYQMIQSPASA